MAAISRVGKRGAWVIPASLRRRFGLEEGALLIAEGRDDGILLRPAVAMPVEVYSARRRAELLLENAVDADDYATARKAVEAMGLDPDAMVHKPPRAKRRAR